MLQADRELTFNTPDLGHQSEYFTRILWSRLCWKVTGVVLLSFIVVELLILVPSALNFRQAFIGNIRDVALASVVPLLPEFSGQNASKDLLLDALEARHPAVLGGALYDREGNLLGNFGVHPEWGAFDFAHNDKTVVEDDDLYSIESYWNGQQISQPYDLVLKIDISSMPYQFFLYICRIGGLILIIAFTLTTMLVLTIGRLVFFPLLHLRDVVENARHNPESADIRGIETNRQDEIGQLATSCRQLLDQTAQSLVELRDHREALADANTKLEQAVAERTAALVTANRSLKAEIAERVQAEAQLTHQAMHDALTKLPNRVLFRDRLAQALFVARRNQENIAVLCLDLDRFKEVNDTLGHAAGDELLKQIGTRVGADIRESDTLARLGGDEYAIIQVGQSQPDGSQTLASRLMSLADEPFILDGHEVIVGISIGIAIGPTDADKPDALLSNADIALRRAKSDGRRSFRFFEPSMDAHRRHRLATERDLRRALAEQQLELYYQPQINSRTNRICGLEALIRWHHPERGIVSPIDFIPVAEETGLILPIGDWIFHQACQDAAAWPDHVRVSINLSPAQFQHRDLAAVVEECLQQSRLDPNRLELEITEGILLKDTENTLKVLHRLKDLGVHIAMDDFGTGYSSLSYLRSFPFDTIKIDRSFVFGLGDDTDARAIVRAVVGLGQNLGMRTIAEGVETPDQMTWLRDEGCEEVQGFLFSEPIPKDAVRKFIADHLNAAVTNPVAKMELVRGVEG